jgi:cell division protein FtsZ
MIFGAVIDPNMGDEIRITVIATGFERAGIPRRMIERPTSSNIGRLISEPQRPVAASAPAPQRPIERESVPVAPTPAPTPAPVQTPPPAHTPEFKPQTNYQEDLDIPTFLRNRR